MFSRFTMGTLNVNTDVGRHATFYYRVFCLIRQSQNTTNPHSQYKIVSHVRFVPDR